MPAALLLLLVFIPIMRLIVGCQMGTLEVTNHRTRHKAILTFKTTDMFHKDLHKVEGYIYDSAYVPYLPRFSLLLEYRVLSRRHESARVTMCLRARVRSYFHSKPCDHSWYNLRVGSCSLHLSITPTIWNSLPHSVFTCKSIIQGRTQRGRFGGSTPPLEILLKFFVVTKCSLNSCNA